MLSPAMFWRALAAAALLPASIFGQNTFDNSGNSLLAGTYFIRQVLYANLTDIGQIQHAESLAGTVVFDGNGNYTVNAQVSDNTVSSGAPSPLTGSGTYSVSAGGLFIMDNPLSTGDTIYGGLGKSAMTGSSTESAFFDFMVAVPMASTATNASLNGTYRVVGMEYPNGDVTQVLNSTFLMQPDGNGNLGAITVSGHAVSVSDSTFSQTISGATYSLSGTTGTLTFPAPSGTALIAGTKQFFVSADGNILVGGALNGYDIEVGINVSGSSAGGDFSGVYYSGGETYDSSTINDPNYGYYYLDAFYGSANVVTSSGNTTTLIHQRVNPDDNFAYDYTFDDEFVLGSDGSVTEQSYQFFVGAGGNARIEVGQSNTYAIELDLQAVTLPQSGPVYLSPLGVVNTANYVPTTNPVAPGEFLTLFGSGLAPSNVTSNLPFPVTGLNGVTVSINGTAAPVYVVSPTEIICIAPFELSDSYAVVQVNNNGNVSNSVTLFTDYSAPGVFTLDESGTGAAAAVDVPADGSTPFIVGAGNPASVGDTIELYLNGLGTVTPSVADGVGAPTSTLSTTDDGIDVDVDGQPATVLFSGLAPTFAGLYQVNFTVPSTQDSGPVYVDVADAVTGAYNSMAVLYVTGTTSARSPVKTGRPASRRLHRRMKGQSMKGQSMKGQSMKGQSIKGKIRTGALAAPHKRGAPLN